MEKSTLHISQLPNELLFMIIEALQDDVETNKRSGGPDIKNCRLVCRRFCDLSSRLLVRSVQVGHSHASLDRLNAIARHASISLGVRTIEVVLSSYLPFKPSLEGKRDFINLQLKWLPKSVQLFEVGRMRNLTESDAQVLHKAHEVLSCWRYMVQEPRMQPSPRGDLALHRILTEKAFQTFQKLAQEQESLVRGAMEQAIASALLRMPWVRRLTFDDTHTYGFLRRRLSRETSSTVVEGIYQNTLLPLTRRDLGQRPPGSFSDNSNYFGLLETTPRVLAAVGGTSQVLLKSLEVDVEMIALNRIFLDTPDLQRKVISATKKLTDLSIKQKKKWAREPVEELFLGHCCTSPDLRTYSVALETGKYSVSHLFTGPGAKEQRESLTVIQVSGADIRVLELKQFLKAIPDVLDRVELSSVRLVGGSWREVLDMLREKTYRESKDWAYPVRIFEAINPDPSHPLSRTFDEIFESDATWEVSDADAYVLRHKEVNPFAPEAGNFPQGHTFNG